MVTFNYESEADVSVQRVPDSQSRELPSLFYAGLESQFIQL